MSIQQPVFQFRKKEKGQSFVELLLVFSVLMILLAGMVEFGYLLNQYINIVDGAREGARFGSNDDPFADVTLPDGTVVSNYEIFFEKIYQIVEGSFAADGTRLSKGAINPITLSKANHDDIVVTFFSVTTTPATGAKSVRRFTSGAGSRYDEQTTRFPDNSQILALIDGTAPNTGVLLVEIFYNYHQLLKMFNTFSGGLLPDPILVHAYSVMPLSSAEPTPTPRPSP